MADDTFRQRELSTDEKEFIESVCNKAGNLEQMINDVVPDGRYKALAKTALEEAVMWANKGITRRV